ncbi:glycosyl transferase [Rhizobium sp. Leaf384]|uniref:glycosyltransferase family 2 protein n=1 Tax=unclassified Rhizobium TaxID=2613769 RepID=UPI000713D639|nr:MULTISPECIES: glycosyltransferase family 2 protein [unclassified Rhizobium]KQS76663.1 glycosyl transferase [Rhizobium sp. Leaf383]KQS77931.1 glycosyl transferase [Rhizobium sp. Leaf384]
MSSIDVVVPNYNYGRYLRACVQSVLDQQSVTVRVLIVDNASTDDSAAIATALAAEDERVHVVLRSRNLGTHASFNQGIDWAEADYFLLLCADDVLSPGALSRALHVLDSDRSLSFCHGRDVPLRGDLPMPSIALQGDMPAYRRVGTRAFIARFCRMGVFQISSPTVVVRTCVQKRAGHYRETLPHTDDYEMWLRLALHGPVAELDCVQAGLRSHDCNRSKLLVNDELQHILHTIQAAQSFFDHEGGAMKRGRSLRRQALQGLAHRAYWCGVIQFLREGTKASDYFRLAFRLSPIVAILPPIAYLLSRPDRLRRFVSLPRLE